jgi:hypothetical protein
VYVEFAIDITHLFRVPENQADKDVDGTLVREPEAKRITTKMDIVKYRCEQYAGTKRNQEPDDQNLGQEAQRGFPVAMDVVFVFHRFLPIIVVNPLPAKDNSEGHVRDFICRTRPNAGAGGLWGKDAYLSLTMAAMGKQPSRIDASEFAPW